MKAWLAFALLGGLCSPTTARAGDMPDAAGMLAGMNALWVSGGKNQPGHPTAAGAPVLARNLSQVLDAARTRTPAEADAAYADDRRKPGYSVIDGLGPLAPAFRAASGATTTISGSEASSPHADDIDRGTGAGLESAPLGPLIRLEQRLTENSSTRAAKIAFAYPRPWRQALDGSSLQTVLLPALRAHQDPDAIRDGGFPSGHTNAAFLYALAMAYAVPQRFQEMLTRASELGENRIIAGMHSPLDVAGGRDMAIIHAIHVFSDPANTALRRMAVQATQSVLSGALGDLGRVAHHGQDALAANDAPPPADPASDRFADRADNAAAWSRRRTGGLPQIYRGEAMLPVPDGSDTLLETRFPYLDPVQRQAILQSTMAPRDDVIADADAAFGQLDLFRAADGYAGFTQTVTVTMENCAGGFSALDAWRNDIAGAGGLTKRGTGTLALAGRNRFSGHVAVQQGTLAATSTSALGRGDVGIGAATLLVAGRSSLHLSGTLRMTPASVLQCGLSRPAAQPVPCAGIDVRHTANLAGTLRIVLPADARQDLILIHAGHRQGTFRAMTILNAPPGEIGQLVYQPDAVILRLLKTPT